MTALGTQGSSAEAQGRLWSARAEDWATIMEPVGAREVYDDVLRRLAVGSGIRLLDAGCGSGVFLGLAIDAGAKASGIDAAPALVEIATRRLPKADVVVGELEQLPYDDHVFDVVTGFNSFQYAANPAKALAEAGRVTEPGGRVVAVVWGNPEDCE